MHELDAFAGKALFERTWVTAPASTVSADGLGPYYDARSCAACHPAAGAGVIPDSLTIMLDDPVYGRQLQRHAVIGMPAEALVHFSTVGVSAVSSADEVKGSGSGLQRTVATFDNLQFGPVSSAFSLRRAPALAGVSRFEEVSEAALRALADPQDANGDGISGRIAGRYGWKAEVATLTEQVARAFSSDMGISTEVFAANSGDCTAAQRSCVEHPANIATGAEVEAEPLVVDLIVLYLRSLPPPAVRPDDAEGRALFSEFGCAACHVSELDTATVPLRAWSDLLLHDLGAGLAVGTNGLRTAEWGEQNPEPPAQSTGPANDREWRTAPLWGLAQRQAYLHDGRARSVEEAILWHGGEAEASKVKFANAGESQRQRLQAFLLGL